MKKTLRIQDEIESYKKINLQTLEEDINPGKEES